MPRSSAAGQLLNSLQKQGAKALASLQREITKREKELDVLKAAEARWKEVASVRLRAAHRTTLQTRARRKRPRLDWDAVLAGLSNTFTAKDVEQKTGKPMEQVYAGVARWVKDRKVRKNPAGGYQKIATASVSQKRGS